MPRQRRSRRRLSRCRCSRSACRHCTNPCRMGSRSERRRRRHRRNRRPHSPHRPRCTSTHSNDRCHPLRTVPTDTDRRRYRPLRRRCCHALPRTKPRCSPRWWPQCSTVACQHRSRRRSPGMPPELMPRPLNGARRPLQTPDAQTLATSSAPAAGPHSVKVPLEPPRKVVADAGPGCRNLWGFLVRW
jgi:hypothetical protein